MATLTERIAAKACSLIDNGNYSVLGSRMGTATAEESRLCELFGPPFRVTGGKVTKRWIIKTPRGAVELRDYWWNAKNEWSIGSATESAARWAVRFLRAHQVTAQ